MQKEWIGLIPAAGKGVRLGLPYPKELYPVICNNSYQPVAQYVLNNLVVAGLEHVIFVVNETKHQLMGYFGNGRRFGCNISYVVQETPSAQANSTSPGLAHALDAAYHLTRGKTVFFGMADTIMQPDEVFRITYAAATPEDDLLLTLFPTERPEKFGMVRLGQEQQVVEICDKPQQTDLTLMWGSMVWQPRFTEYLHERVCHGISDFADIINGAIAEGMRVRGVEISDGTYLDLGTYDEIAEIEHFLRNAQNGKPVPA